MSEFVFKLPDLGEGTVEAELVEWHVKAGDTVQEDQPLVDVMTDKANVEIPCPVNGTVKATHGEPGDVVAVGTELAAFEVESAAAAAEAAAPAPRPAPAPTGATRAPAAAKPHLAEVRGAPERRRGTRPLTSPAIRRRAREQGIDLGEVHGSGPGGRIRPEDLEAHAEGRGAAAPARRRSGVDEIKVIGVRRVIAERMSAAKREIPHFAYVEDIDVTELEALRVHLGQRFPDRPLTYLPFIATALIRALDAFPQCNATYDAERNVILRHHAVHLGIATQTEDGLKVPVVEHAEALDLWALAASIFRVTTAARDGSARRAELTGSTVTLTSLGRLGGIVSTPVINAPEVAIVGVNRAEERPVVRGGQIVVRRMLNLSSSFDHRFVDGHDAAAMIQAVKNGLEHPATLFVPAPE